MKQTAYQKRIQQYRKIISKSTLHMKTLELYQNRREGKAYTEDKSSMEEALFVHILAPTITEYVEWVLATAQQKNKKRLYFLARDGWMMYHTAKKIVEARKIDMDIRYLKVSRYAVRGAEYYIIGKKCLDTICVGGIDITLQKIMQRALLNEKESRQIAGLTTYSAYYEKNLNYRQIQLLKQELEQNELLFTYIKMHSRHCYESAAGYFRQEGLLDHVPYALVDSGWIGTLQMSIQNVLHSISNKPIELIGMYFGLYERPRAAKQEQYLGYYFTPEKGMKRKVHFSNCLFETIFSSPEGMTQRYERTNTEKMYQAVESNQKNPNAMQIDKYDKYLMDYVACYLCNTSVLTNREKNISADMVQKLLSHMMGNPTKAELEIFGELLFCDDVMDNHLLPVAAQWSTKEVTENRFLHKVKVKMNLETGELHESAWPEGSITRMGMHVMYNLRQERMYKYFMYLRKRLGIKNSLKGN